MKRKLLIALNIAILIAFLAPYVIQAYGATANAYPYHPEVKLYGKVTKDWHVGRSWTEYRDDQGLSSFLPFNRTNENITIPFHQIVFSKNFMNKTIASATESGDTTEFTVTKDVLVEDEQEYIYLKIANKTTLTASTGYSISETLDISDEPAVNNDYYLIATAKVQKTASNLLAWGVEIQYVFVDSGATTRYITLKIAGNTGTDIISVSGGVITVKVFGKENTYYTMQYKIQDILDAAGVSWSLVKLKQIRYAIAITTGSTLDDSTTVEAWIKHALVLPSKVYIDDPAYTDGLIVNGTSGQFTPSAGDVLQIYGANASKVIDVTIPFVYEDTRDFDEICTALAECYGFQYEWKFILPKSPTNGDELTYSETNITLKCWFDGAYIDKLYVNGVDKTTQVTSKKVNTETGIQDKDRAWTYLVASSLTAGNQYDVELKVKDLPKDVWYDLTTEPMSIISWQWWYDKLLLILAFISNLLGGIGSSWIKAQREKLRAPKR